MPKNALLIVDVQNDFCPGGALPVPEGDQVIWPLNRMIEYARKEGWLILASRDWHPEETGHFEKFGGRWPVHCVAGTDGAKFHSGLKFPRAGVIIISKGTKKDEDAYSAFQGAWLEKPLEEVLRDHRVNRIHVGGLATDYCVKATVLDALERGFKVTVLADACRGVNLKPDDSTRAIWEMHGAGALFSSSKVITRSTS